MKKPVSSLSLQALPILLLLTLTACSGDVGNHYSPGSYDHAKTQLQQALKQKNNTKEAKGIILFVGDGMSVPTVTAGRIYAGQKNGQAGEEHQLSFERFPYAGLVKTYNTNQQTPDSAGTMTAMLTGSKTKAGVVSVNTQARRADPESCRGYNLKTLLEQAEDQGWATGIVTTTSVTHATPAAAYAHTPERNWESDAAMSEAAIASGCKDIASQLIDFDYGNGIEVVLGGGRQFFLPQTGDVQAQPGRESAGRRDGRNLIDEWQARHKKSVYVSNATELKAVDTKKTRHLLGLFADSHLDFEADRVLNEAQDQPALSEMVATALALLKKQDRFLLIVESGRIDHAHHIGNAYRALEEMLEFDYTVNQVAAQVDLDETLVIVTADHSHTMTIAGYPTRGNPILGFVKGNDDNGEPNDDVSLASDKKPYTTLSYANGPGYFNEPYDGDNPFARFMSPPSNGRQTTVDDDPQAPHYHQEAGVPLRTETHAGDDIAVYAQGPWAHLLTGVIEQNYLYHVMKHAGDL